MIPGELWVKNPSFELSHGHAQGLILLDLDSS